MAAVLRAMTGSDLDTLLVVQREGSIAALGHVFPQEDHPFPTDDVRRRWEQEIADPGTDCFVVVGPEDTHDVVGFAATRGNELLHFGTAVRLWGSGLAGLAHDEVLAHLRDQGHREAVLRVFEGNARARRFYERRGWQPTGERSRSGFAPYPVLLGYRVELVTAAAAAR